ncbi:hypothetical protein H072_10653 [Dactylellina haptotyla CBS 200.50]|uniref:Thioredoxin domain-containing protein n=1 Tax=Dactylellina haptotyla (strain CBS 200.50) TaxID=1284197 RepID=S7ZZM4_DACHA|nr:hypothetical protein H072_10653 [Dactylellina haptotyla CBS 200.50]
MAIAAPRRSKEGPPEKPMLPSASNGLPPSPSHLPSQSEWESAQQLYVQDSDGIPHKFGSLIHPDSETDTVVVLFVRHFYCGLCQNYIESLSPSITPETLMAHKTRLIIIGCGGHGMIKQYAEDLKTPFPVYTDHTRAIYRAFGMGRTLQGPAKKPAYVRTSVVEMGLKAFKHVVKSAMQGGALWDAGDMSQVGGEWVVRNGNLEWGHRMPDTAGHMSAEEIWDVVKFRSDKTSETQISQGVIRAGTMEKHGALEPAIVGGPMCGCS